MRDLVYYVATSIDGFIAAHEGDFSPDPATVKALFEIYPETCPVHVREHIGISGANRRFDTVIMGYQTLKPALDVGLTSAYPHMRQIVATHRELPPDDSVETVQGDLSEYVAALRKEPGQDIWLCGGADIAGQLIDEIDEIQVKINPVVFGQGTPLFQMQTESICWKLVDCITLPAGVLLVTYRRV